MDYIYTLISDVTQKFPLIQTIGVLFMNYRYTLISDVTQKFPLIQTIGVLFMNYRYTLISDVTQNKYIRKLYSSHLFFPIN